MKIISLGILTCALVMTLSAHAWAGWVITSDVEASSIDADGKEKPATRKDGQPAGQKTVAVLKVQGEKLRQETGSVITIFDSKTQEQIVLMKESKTYSRVTGPEFRAQMEKSRKLSGIEPGATPAKFQATGKEEKIGEYPTKEYTATGSKGHKITFWVTTQEPAPKARTEALDIYEKMYLTGEDFDLKGLPGYPIKAIHERPGMVKELPNGKRAGISAIKLTKTVTSMKEEEIDAKEFEVPAGYVLEKAPGAGK